MAVVTERVRAVLLLEQAAGYGLASLAALPAGGLGRPTPCAGWTVADLLGHLRESMAALQEATDHGAVALLPPAGPHTGPPAEPAGPPAGPADPVAAVRAGAARLLAGWRRWAARPGPACVPVRVGGLPVPGDTVALVGALELAVHGWDLARACADARPIPAPLALAILRRAPQLADASTRTAMFAAPVPVSPLAAPSDRLVAFLGRDPAHPATG